MSLDLVDEYEQREFEMSRTSRLFPCLFPCLFLGLALSWLGTMPCRGQVKVTLDRPQTPPDWALLERELLRANESACKEFFKRYFDERGYLRCVERWGGDDGPDDAIENLIYWPILHAAGASDSVLEMYKHAWEGHLRQYTAAKTTDVPFARDGMYYKEFPVMFDWLHNAEGLTVFNLQGLSDPYNGDFRKRVKRYAGFYLNEDAKAPNYDAEHKIIRSLFNGSRGPLLRKATGLDWAGDPIEVAGRFRPGHGEETYAQMVAHFKDYNDIVGDHPSNLLATSLALNAFMLEQDPKYRRWIEEYVGAWRERMKVNGGLIPSNIGLDGTIGGNADGKWYGGVYGWGFSVTVPQTGAIAHRETFHLGAEGFLNAVLLTGDRSWMDPWRTQMDRVNANRKVVNGTTLYPHKFGDDGWYNFTPQPYSSAAREIYYVTLDEADRKRAPANPWFEFLNGRNPAYPETVLRQDFSRIRTRVAAMRADLTTPDTRLADDPIKFNPASIQSLIELTMGGLYPGKTGLILHCRLRYFDPLRRRAGLPRDVAALVESMTDGEVVVSLVNTNQQHARTVVLQAGGYAEHQFKRAQFDGQDIDGDDSQLTVRLSPGSGGRLRLSMHRYANRPTMRFPWDR